MLEKKMRKVPIPPGFQEMLSFPFIYANNKAFKTLQGSKPFPDGTVMIFDLLEAKNETNAIVEGSRKVLEVMQKDSKKFAKTGVWGFEGFKVDSQERVLRCLICLCISSPSEDEGVTVLI